MKEEIAKELALAILLWKFWRHEVVSRKDAGCIPTDNAMKGAYMALEMAKAIGISVEYLNLVFEHPILTFKIKELEKYDWKRSKPGGMGVKK